MTVQVRYRMCSVTSSDKIKVDFRGNGDAKGEPGKKEQSQSIEKATDKFWVVGI